LARTEVVPGTRRLVALGFDFAVHADDPALARYLDRIFGHLAVAGEPANRYRLRETERSDGSDGRRELVVELNGHPLLETAHRTLALAHLLWHINQQVIDSTQDLLLFHASAAEHDGVGILFPATAESGKTTLVAGVVRAGLRYVTDEAAAIDLDTITLHPYAKPLSVDPGSWEVLADLAPQVEEAVEPYLSSQWHVDPLSIRPDALASVSDPRFVVFPSYIAGAGTHLEPVGRAEAVLLLSSNCFNLSRFGRRGFEAMTELVRGADCYRLTVDRLDDGVGAVLGLYGLTECAPALAERAP
jgi:hypothetical protein